MNLAIVQEDLALADLYSGRDDKYGVESDNSPNNLLGGSVGERLACHRVVPGSIPGVALSSLFLHMVSLRFWEPSAGRRSSRKRLRTTT